MDGNEFRERRVAAALYQALRSKGPEEALVLGNPDDGESTLIDGTFDLRELARAAIHATELKPE